MGGRTQCGSCEISSGGSTFLEERGLGFFWGGYIFVIYVGGSMDRGA